MTTYRELFTQGQRALPKNATFHQRGQATKKIAKAWRSMKRSGSHESSGGTHSNPSMPKVSPKLLVMAAAAYVGYQYLKGRTPAVVTTSAPSP